MSAVKQKELVDTYLAQRLARPSVWNAYTKKYCLPDVPKDVPVVIKDGTIDLQAMGKVRPAFWKYDDMGAAEYEFGAVPETLERIAQKRLCTFAFEIPFSKIQEPWTHGSWVRKGKKEVYVDPPPLVPPKSGKLTVYVICGHDETDGARATILDIASGKTRVKNGAQFGYAAWAPHTTEEQSMLGRDVGGWLEETNAFWFFIDSRMYLGACQMFGVTPVQGS